MSVIFMAVTTMQYNVLVSVLTVEVEFHSLVGNEVYIFASKHEVWNVIRIYMVDYFAEQLIREIKECRHRVLSPAMLDVGIDIGLRDRSHLIVGGGVVRPGTMVARLVAQAGTPAFEVTLAWKRSQAKPEASKILSARIP